MSQGDFDINNMTQESLAELNSEQIVKLVLSLKDENDKLRSSAEEVIALKYEERLEKIEREINLSNQYSRRDSIEISGVPMSVPDADVEKEVIKILKTAKAKMGGKFPVAHDIQASHRIGRKGKIICKFVNRKFAKSAVINSKNLKDVLYKPNEDDEGDEAEGHKIYINESLCPEFGYLHYAVRNAKKKKELHAYKIRNGVMNIQKEENGRYVEISHVNDLGKYNLTVPKRAF